VICSDEENGNFSIDKWIYEEALDLLSEPNSSPDIALALIHALVDEYRADYLKLKDEFADLLHIEAGNGLADKSIKNFLKWKGYLK
jgi:hypothetical protein